VAAPQFGQGGVRVRGMAARREYKSLRLIRFFKTLAIKGEVEPFRLN